MLLVALALGFTAYGLWRLVQAIFDRDDEGSGAKGIAKRVGYRRPRRSLRRADVDDASVAQRIGRRRRLADGRGEERDVDGAGLARRPLARRARRADPDRRRDLQRRIARSRRSSRRTGRRRDEQVGARVGRSSELARPPRAIRGLLADRRLLRQGRVPVRPQGGHRSGRCAPEGRRRELRAGAPRPSSPPACSATRSSASSKPVTVASEALSAFLFVNPGSGKGGPSVEELTQPRTRARRAGSRPRGGRRPRRARAGSGRGGAGHGRRRRLAGRGRRRWPSSETCPSSASRGARATTSRTMSASTPTIRWRRSRPSATESSGESMSAAWATRCS